MLITLLFSAPVQFITIAIALILALSFHEAAHAYVSDKLGDNTAKLMGRLTLNPSAHLDPIGLIMLLLLGFGWGKPVPVNPNNFKNPVRDEILVAIAGPISNLILTTLATLIYWLTLPITSAQLQDLLIAIGFYNLIIMFFNLIPIPPLDGSKILYLFLPFETIQMINQYGIFVLLFIIFVPIGNINLINLIIFNPSLKILIALFHRSIFF